jgi:hypothetical protein
MTTTPRISAADLSAKLAREEDTLLVCAYADPNACQQHPIEGALDFQAFEAKLPSLAKDQEIVFYCA